MPERDPLSAVEDALVEGCPHRPAPGLCTIGGPAVSAPRETCGACVRARHPEAFAAPGGDEEAEPPGVPPGTPPGDLPGHLCRVCEAPHLFAHVGGERLRECGELLANRFAGTPAILVGGGPSLERDGVIPRLRASRALKMAVNNVGALVNPTLWCSIDGPSSFSDRIWRDPNVMKFARSHHPKSEVRAKRDGEFVRRWSEVGRMPNVWYFDYQYLFRHDTFLSEPWFCAGRKKGSADTLGIEGGRSVLLVALKLLLVLGVRKIYLFGVDFWMEPGAQYCFPQVKNAVTLANGHRSDPDGDNNRTFDVTARRLAAMEPYFRRAGVEILNCNPRSRLAVFPSSSYDAALAECGGWAEGEPDLAGWYG